jgi:CHASE1-domain containing sensor protein
MTSWIKVKGIPFTILGLGCLLTIFLYLWSVSSERARGAAEFAGLTEKFRTELSARVQSYIDTLPGLKAFVVLEKNRSDLQFQQFVSTVSLQKRFPGIALTFIADRVLQSNLDAYVTAVRADDSEQKSANRSFTVQPPGLRSEYMIVRHASPETPNTVGYDLYDPTKQYRKEVDQAAASGQPTATPPVTLARDRDAPLVAANASVLVRLAVYSTIGVPNTQAQRAQALIGMAGVAFKTRELIASVLSPEMETRLKMQILDLHAPESQSLVFDTNWLRSDGDSGASPPLRSVLRVANREWTVIAVDRQAAQVYWTRPIPILVLIFGLSVSFLLSLLLRSLVQATAKAETSVEQALDKVKQEQIALEEAQSIARMGSWKWDVVEKKLFFSAELVRILEIESDQFLRDPNSFYSRIRKRYASRSSPVLAMSLILASHSAENLLCLPAAAKR